MHGSSTCFAAPLLYTEGRLDYKNRHAQLSACAVAKDGVVTKKDAPRPYIIQIDRPGPRLAIADVRDLLAGTGVQLDDGYGPVPVDPAAGRYVVRGTATRAARRRAEKIRGVRFFGDVKIGPLG